MRSLLVQQHDFEIRHRPGTSHANADALSRRLYKLPIPTVSAYDVPGVQTSRVKELQHRDPDLADLINYLESATLPDKDKLARSLLLTIDDYFLSDDGLLFHLWTHGKPIIPLPASNLSFLQLYAIKSLLGVMMTLPQDTLAPLRLMRSCGHATIGAICLVTYSIGAEVAAIVLCERAPTTATRRRLYHPVQDAFERVACVYLGPLQTLLRGTIHLCSVRLSHALGRMFRCAFY